MSPSRSAALRFAIPPVFVVLWATGFVVARLIAPYAEPLTFLVLRFAASSAIMALVALAGRASWPTTTKGWRDTLVAGILIHGLYLSGVFWAVRHGLSAGISALIAGLQPLLTACLAGPLLGERVAPRRWLGIVIGFVGAVLVLSSKIGGGTAYPPLAVLVCFGGTVSITLGLIWQKRTGTQTDLRAGTAIQYLGALLVAAPLAALTEHARIETVPAFWIGLAWAVLGLSIGAVVLLLVMIRRGAVAGVSALMFLVPPVAALIGFGLFDERLDAVQIAGMVLAAIGVAIASRG